MKRWSIVVVVGVLLALTLACGGGGSSSQVKIEVVNQSPEDVCYVYISESDSDEWGGDQLGDEDTISPGDSKTFEVPKGTYDVRLENCDEIAMETGWQVSKDTTITAGAPGATSWVLLDNQSSADVCYVFIAPASDDDWGADWMGGNEDIPAGEQRLFYIKPGVYDLLAQDCGQNDLAEADGVDLSTGRPWVLSGN